MRDQEIIYNMMQINDNNKNSEMQKKIQIKIHKKKIIDVVLSEIKCIYFSIIGVITMKCL